MGLRECALCPLQHSNIRYGLYSIAGAEATPPSCESRSFVKVWGTEIDDFPQNNVKNIFEITRLILMGAADPYDLVELPKSGD